MKITLNLVAPNGTVKTLHGEALPSVERPTMPLGAAVSIGADDKARLCKAALRLRRCEVALGQLGKFDLNFGAAGFTAGNAGYDLALKALALEARPFLLNDDPLFLFSGACKASLA